MAPKPGNFDWLSRAGCCFPNARGAAGSGCGRPEGEGVYAALAINKVDIRAEEMREVKKRRVQFIVPVHNEESIVTRNIETLLHYGEGCDYPFDWLIHIVVNGSSDRTLEMVSSLGERFPNRVLVTNFPEPGRGSALKRAWLASDADVVMYMDVDLAVSLEHLTELVRPILAGECDMVIGSRNLIDSKIKRSLLREVVSQSYNLLSRLILNHGFSDLQCGFKAVRMEVFKVIAPRLESTHWFFDTELVLWAKKHGFTTKEIPVDWSENRYEKRKSKVRLVRDSGKFFLDLLRLRFRMTRAVVR